MDLEQFDLTVRYDPQNGFTLPDAAAMKYADEMVKCGKLDITVGSEFLLTCFRYSLKVNNIDPSRFVYVLYDKETNEPSTVLIDKDYNYNYGLDGEFKYPDDMCRMLLELF